MHGSTNGAEGTSLPFIRCLELVEACAVAQGWQLGSDDCRRYAMALAGILAPDAPDDLLCDSVANYHADHQVVLALHDSLHPQHTHAWQAWMRQALLILRREGLAWSSDLAVTSDDLAQIACAELARALPGYRFQSRFASWAARVVVQIIRRYVRDSLRDKRALRPDSLDQAVAAGAALPPASQAAEATAHAQVLYDLIMACLAEQPDQRLARIFQLVVIEDRRIAEVGTMFGISQQRARALLLATKVMLRKHPAIMTWVQAED